MTTTVNISGVEREIKIISIEGNIGAGKSTLLSKLMEYTNILKGLNGKYNFIDEKIVFVKEPIDIWETITDPETGKNMIELFYENPRKWAFAFQMMVITTQENMIEDILKKNPLCEIIISERSIDAGKHVFTEMLVDAGFISAPELQIYDLFFDNCKYKTHTAIYLNIDVKTCFERINERARLGENAIEMTYLEDCDRYYRNWLFEYGEIYQNPQNTFVMPDNSIDLLLPIIMPIFEKFKY
jgi:deoxyadenosine/deoxycytidine kinase